MPKPFATRLCLSLLAFAGLMPAYGAPESPQAPPAAARAAAAAPKGSLVIIGGGLRGDNADVWGRIVQLAGGKGARIAVFPSASGDPERAAQSIIGYLKKFGADAFAVPVAVRLADSDYRKAAEDAALAEKIRKADGVYFAGGDQSRSCARTARAPRRWKPCGTCTAGAVSSRDRPPARRS